ncbi:MAG TPA: SRPBCC domain-containing protein [Candidatus Acidoferrum sp.]|nr:SRPBCC domain-containing protein [Candidatus Acidoferrum sp.]
MATSQSQPQNAIQLRRTFAAPRERVFRAWTDAREFALWFHPTTEHTTVITRLDLKVGGNYSLEMHHKGGAVHKLSGTYQQIKPPEKLAFTWRWATDPPGQETLVSLDFLDKGNATEVVLSHGEFPDEETREKHNHGWLGCLDQLQHYLA